MPRRRQAAMTSADPGALDWRPILAILALLCGWLGASAGRADAVHSTRETEPPGYRDAIAGGLQEFELGNFEEAREQFARAHALMPSARTLRGLGMAEFELRNYVEAVDYLEQALASRTRQLESALRQETEALLTKARGYVGEVRLRIEPTSAWLIVDGVNRHQPVPARLALDVGEHLLEFEASGHASQRRTLQVRGGQTQSLTVELSALEVGAAREPALAAGADKTRDAPTASAPLYKRWWLWTTVAIVVAGAATGVALALTAKDKEPAYRAAASPETPSGVQLHPLWGR